MRMYKNLPPQLQNIAEQLQQSDKNQEEVVFAVYDIVSRHFTSARHRTYLRLWDLFRTDLVAVWNKGGFCHCTQQNELIKQTLIASGMFSAEDITKQWGMNYYISPHQWLKVNINNTVIDVDPWGRHFGVPFGKHATGFNTTWKQSWQE